MNSNAFDVLTRHAGAHSRRGALRALGGVALVSTLAAPAGTAAGKAGKHKHKKTKNPCKNQEPPCTNQQPQCVTEVTAYCTTWSDRTACEGLFLPCCARFTGCDVEPGLACLFAAISDV